CPEPPPSGRVRSRRRTIMVASLIGFVSCRSPAAPSDTACDEALWSHVYERARLRVLAPCRSVTGRIQAVRIQTDGDYHIQLVPDDRSVLNLANVEQQDGALIIEAICQ